MITVAREPTPWTRPGELPFIAGQPLPALDDSDPQGYLLGLVDGSVRPLPTNEARMLPFLITRAGGEIITWPEAHAARVASVTGQRLTLVPTATAPPTAALSGGMIVAASPPSIESRLAVVEQKLDLVIRKLDAILRDVQVRRSGATAPAEYVPRKD